MFEQEPAIIARFEMCPKCRDISVLVPVQTVKRLVENFNTECETCDIGHYFCLNEDCEVVYFSSEYQYITSDVTVPVYQKDQGEDVPVCYCHNLTRRKIQDMIASGIDPVEHLDERMKNDGCSCKINNPQGSCCRNNVILYTQSIKGHA